MIGRDKKFQVLVKSLCLAVASLMILGTAYIPKAYGVEIKYTDSEGKTIKSDDFLDTKGHWAHDKILKWAEYAVLNGYNGKFMPNEKITRGDLACVIDRMLGLKTTSFNYFKDLQTDAYYRDPILRCVAEDYISGVGNNMVNPKGYATREEVATILSRVFDIDTENDGVTHFSDNYLISTWARPSIYSLTKLGYMNGQGNNMMNPKAYITRAEVITLLDNIADIYLPKKDTIGIGSSFTMETSKNIITSRAVSLVRSSIGRDFIVTQSSTNVSLEETTVRGRVLLLGKATLSLNNSIIDTIVIKNKSSVNGIANSEIEEVYISAYGTESNLDRVPNKLVLEAGTRVKIDGIMYENTTNKTKTYDGIDIKADIAAEQGYVTGGPKVSGVVLLHEFNNNVRLQKVKVTQGEAEVDEIGVIYNDDNTTPTLQNYDEKIKYKGEFKEPFEIQAGEVDGTRTYRVYTLDENGLIGYSIPFTATEYEFTVELDIFNINYPETMRTEVLFNGENIPAISNVKVVYSTDELYAEEHNVKSLTVEQLDSVDKNNPVNTLIRYTGEIKSQKEIIDGVEYYNPPTAFGYIITFANGTVVKQFPVLTNAVPEGIAPVEQLRTGNANFSTTNKLNIVNNKIITRHVAIQEAGVVYREVPTDTPLSEPVIDTNGWVKKAGYVDVGLKDTAYYSVSIPVTSTDGETQFASYVKTANGYYYGNVKSVNNNWQGTENGPKIMGMPEVLVLDGTKAVVNVPIQLIQNLDLTGAESIISFTDKFGSTVSRYNASSLNIANAYVNPNKNTLSLIFDNLAIANIYDVNLQLFDTLGEASNAISFTIDMSDLIPMTLSDKTETTKSVKYTLNTPTISSMSLLNPTDTTVLNSSITAYMDTATTPWHLVINGAPLSDLKVQVDFDYYIARGIGNIRTTSFTRTFTIQK